MNQVILKHKESTLKATIELPASKSISNRLLVLQHLYHSPVQIGNLSKADDTQVMKQALGQIAKGQVQNGMVDVGDCGTAMRFLTSILALTPGQWLLKGSNRMHERPIRDLVDALRQMGASINYHEKEGFPPLQIKGNPLLNNHTSVNGAISSQFISSLMMIGPALPNGLHLDISGSSSRPYIMMTAEVMNQCGLVVHINQNYIQVEPHRINQAPTIYVEPDWSAAGYWYSFAALSKDSDIYLSGLNPDSMQGDSVLNEIYKKYFGIQTVIKHDGLLLKKQEHFIPETTISINAMDCPDQAQTIALTAFGLNISLTLNGTGSLQYKEAKRAEVLVHELNKLAPGSAKFDEENIYIYNHSALSYKNPPAIQTYGDHRMAMSFAPLSLLFPLAIIDPGVVSKSYPDFWDQLQSSGFIIT